MDEMKDKKSVNSAESAEIYEEEDIKQNKTMAGLAYILFFCRLLSARIQGLEGSMQIRVCCCSY